MTERRTRLSNRCTHSERREVEGVTEKSKGRANDPIQKSGKCNTYQAECNDPSIAGPVERKQEENERMARTASKFHLDSRKEEGLMIFRKKGSQ